MIGTHDKSAHPTADLDWSKAVFGGILERYINEFYLVFRLLFAFMIGVHGAQKAFLLWGFPKDHELGLLVDIAAWVELFAAPLIAFGVLTRLVAGALTVQMAVAYFVVHLPNGLWPHIYSSEGEGFAGFHHGGEIVILLFAMAGIIGIMGSRKWGIERLIFKKEFL